MKLTPVLTTLLFASLGTACLSDGGKGPEDDPFDDYESKTDSFRNPTAHGTLIFGVPQEAALATGQLFHSWDFDLADDANVALETQLQTANLDTVLYLYQQDPVSLNYGAYRYKNDDASVDTVASALTMDLKAGHYRVLVKGFKTSLRGTFHLQAQCTGPGCSASTCDAAVFAGSPSNTNDSCGDLMSAALDGKVVGQSSATVTLAERCSLPSQVAAAVDYYVDYFGGPDEFADAFSWDPDEPASAEVSWTSYDTGAVYVQVDGGGDEAAMDYLIGADNQVLAHYQHNQSPEHTLYCDGGIEYLEDGECFFEFTENFPHDERDEVRETKSVTVGAAQSGLSKIAYVAVQAYAAELSLSSSKSVTVTATTWALGGSNAAGRVEVKTSGQDAYVYELEALANTQWLFTIKRGSSAVAYDCREL